MEGKKIIIICSRLDTPGGIERAVTNTANLFAEKGHTVTLLVADNNGSSGSYYPLHPSVHPDYRPFSFGIGITGNVNRRHIRNWNRLYALTKQKQTILNSIQLFPSSPILLKLFIQTINRLKKNNY